ncbi:MAG: transketolase C-terminal domain-containing protein, partial [Planctomycetota bacterium]|nr:transketolase C-terminal domain-containing protein [Planctomycetota bacterium]
TVENHSIIGGVGSAAAEVLVEQCPVPMHRVGINDSFGKSGLLDNILKNFGLTPDNIASRCEQFLAGVRS